MGWCEQLTWPGWPGWCTLDRLLQLLAEPGAHRVLDLWLLLAMLTLGPDRRKAAEGMLR